MLIGYLQRMQGQVRIGSRASALALKQAEMVKAAVLRYAPQCAVSIHTMTTQGDRETGKTLAHWGYKGLFTKELEDALLNGEIDIAVHSMKDMPSILPDGLMVAAMLPREDVRDAWISPMHSSFEALPAGTLIGTASLRRAAQILRLHPQVRITALRGNVQTRLNKLASGEAEATFLASAGLKRLGMESAITQYVPVTAMLPAAAQGAIGIELRSDDTPMRVLMGAINDHETFVAVECERAMLRVLDGSCRTPIAGYAVIEGDEIYLRAQVVAPDGSAEERGEIRGAIGESAALGRELGAELKRNVPTSWLVQYA